MGENPKFYGMRFDRGLQNFGFHMIAQSKLIAGDRRRSQEIEHGAIFCNHDSKIVDDRKSMFPYDRRPYCDLRCAIIWKPAFMFYFLRSRSQTIAEVCFHVIADDRRPYCDLRSAIIWKPALRIHLYVIWFITVCYLKGQNFTFHFYGVCTKCSCYYYCSCTLHAHGNQQKLKHQ